VDLESSRSQALASGASVADVEDALGRRVRRTDGSTDTKFTHDGQDVVLDDDPVSGVVKYQNGPDIDNKLSAKTTSNIGYFLGDHLGSTDAISDSSGAIVASNYYNSFGNPTSTGSNSRYQYTGREFDSTTGLHYYRARFYDAGFGKFVSEDPIGFKGGDMNLYGYVKNITNRYRDPLGLLDPIIRQDPKIYQNPNGQPCFTWKPRFGFGLTGGLAASLGLFGGVTADANGYLGQFYNGDRASWGVAGSGGAQANLPIPIDPRAAVGFPGPPDYKYGDFQNNHPFVLGGSAGAGGGFFLTNAGSVHELAGDFYSRQINTPFVSISFDNDGRIGVLSVTFGPTYGASYQQLTTNTPFTYSHHGPVGMIPIYVPR